MRAYLPNPAVCGGRKPVELITDRAKRYRANSKECRPKGPEKCVFCGSGRNPVVMHLDGDEANLDRGNLKWGCKSCNTKLGSLFKKLGLGTPTKQFNPGKLDYGRQNRQAAKLILLDKSQAGTFGEMWARAFLGKGQTRSRHGLRAAKRSQSVRQGRLFNPDKVPTFQQYAFAVAQHRRGSRDEWGKVIHAVPPETRREYARQIARIKKRRGTGRKSEVPF